MEGAAMGGQKGVMGGRGRSPLVKSGQKEWSNPGGRGSRGPAQPYSRVVKAVKTGPKCGLTKWSKIVVKNSGQTREDEAPEARLEAAAVVEQDGEELAHGPGGREMGWRGREIGWRERDRMVGER